MVTEQSEGTKDIDLDSMFFGSGVDSETVKILHELMDLQENLEAKTDLTRKDVFRFGKMHFWASSIKIYSPKTSTIVYAYYDILLQLLVSNKRQGRKEVIEGLKGRMSDLMGARETWKKYLH